MFKKTFNLTVIFCFFLTTLGPLPKAHADAVLGLPTPGTMVNLSSAYQPALIKGLTVHKDNPFLFDFIVDTGHTNLKGEALKKEGDRLVKYFFACLTIPEKDLWVNLSPYEKDRIIPQALGQTALGRDLLAQDYILKQLTASLIYPEKNLGKEFWNRVYAKAQEQYGTTQIPVNTFNKVWILANKATVYEHNQTAFVIEGHLKVMLDEDYLALQQHNSLPLVGRVREGGNNSDSVASQVIRSIILPEIEKEVNEGKNFATVRQIFYAQILATWYKKSLKQALLNQVYADKSTVKGINLSDPSIQEKIYQRYLQAYKKGVFNYIKEDPQADGQSIPRKYFSGGYDSTLDAAEVVTPVATPQVIADLASLAKSNLSDFSVNAQPNAAMTTGGLHDFMYRAKRATWEYGIVKDIYDRVKVIKAKDGVISEQNLLEDLKSAGTPEGTNFMVEELKRDAEDFNKRLQSVSYIVQQSGTTIAWGQNLILGLLQNENNKFFIVNMTDIKGVRINNILVVDSAMQTPSASAKNAAMTVEDAKEILNGKRILLVDDHSNDRRIFRWVLEKAGMIITEAENGQEALDLLDAGVKYDFVLSDYQMPGMTGRELAKSIRESGKSYAGVRMFIQSGTFADDRKIEGLGVREIPKGMTERQHDKLLISIAQEIDAAMTDINVVFPALLRSWQDAGRGGNVVFGEGEMRDLRGSLAHSHSVQEALMVWLLGLMIIQEDNDFSNVRELLSFLSSLPGIGPWLVVRAVRINRWLRGSRGHDRATEVLKRLCGRINKLIRSGDENIINAVDLRRDDLMLGQPFAAAMEPITVEYATTTEPGRSSVVDQAMVATSKTGPTRNNAAMTVTLGRINQAVGEFFKVDGKAIVFRKGTGSARNQDGQIVIPIGSNDSDFDAVKVVHLIGGIESKKLSVKFDLEFQAELLQRLTGEYGEDLVALLHASTVDSGWKWLVIDCIDEINVTQLALNGQAASNRNERGGPKTFRIEVARDRDFSKLIISQGADSKSSRYDLKDSFYYNRDFVFVYTPRGIEKILWLRGLEGPDDIRVVRLEKLRQYLANQPLGLNLEQIREWKTKDLVYLRNLIISGQGDFAQVTTPNAVDNAALALETKGGIDLNTSNDNTQWIDTKDGSGVEMNINPAMLARIRREGLTSLSPLIFKITQVQSVWSLAGLQAPQINSP